MQRFSLLWYVTFFSGLLQKATCSADRRYISSCVLDEAVANRSHVVLKVAHRPWLSHRFSTAIAEIVLKDLLGYSLLERHRVVSYDWGPEMVSEAMDIDMEQWHAIVGSNSYNEFIVQRQEVLDVGFIGYSGRSGLFAFQQLVRHHPLTDFFYFYHNASQIASANVVSFSESQLVTSLGSDFPECDPVNFSWCGSGIFEGYWAAPCCRDSPSQCVEIYHAVPGYDTAYFEQLVRNHNLKAVFGYYGLGMPEYLKAFRGKTQTPLFYWWEPDPLLLEVDAVRISFPDHYPGCDRFNNENPDTGPVKCDYARTMLNKLASRRILDTAPEAFYFLSHLEILMDEIVSLMSAHVANASKSEEEDHDEMPDPDEDESIQRLACLHIKDNMERFRSFAPECITNPPDPVKDGDQVFNAETMQCEGAVVFMPVEPTSCFAEGQRPSTVDRSDRTIKVVRRTWVTHQLVAMLTEVLLRDYLGFNVEVVYQNKTDNLFGEEMLQNFYHVDMEVWRATPGSDPEINYLRSGLLSNMGPLGYIGRNGLYILREVAEKNQILEYYKAYQNVSAEYASVLVTHSDSPLEQVMGEAFPLCPRKNQSDCNRGALDGYWAPPQCLESPGRCIEIVHPTPVWAQFSYIEQLVRNFHLEAVVAYYDFDGMSDVITAQVGAGIASPFFWFEPDPFTTMVDSVRISFPDYYYGCNLQPSYHPDTGNIACDFPPTELLKIAAPVVGDTMEEAYFVLQQIKIYREVIEGLVSQSGLQSETVCDFITSSTDLIREWVPSCLTHPPLTEEVLQGAEVFFPDELECRTVTCQNRQVLRYQSQLRLYYCDDCGSTTVPNEAKNQCVPCPWGEEVDSISGECQACAPGTIAATEGSCALCPAGWFSAGGSATECSPCPPGKSTEMQPGAEACEPCPAGRFVGLAGSNCTACPVGTFAAEIASSACVLCEVGTYAANVSTTACTQCGAGRHSVTRFATMERLDVYGEAMYNYVLGSHTHLHCGCDRGMRVDAGGNCHECSAGMLCPGLGVVLIEPGYYAESLADVSVFKCHGDDRRCIGGEPGSTCARGRRGITCAECKNMMVASSAECVPCSGSDRVPFILFVIGAVLVIVIVDVFSTSSFTKSMSLSVVFCAIAAGQLVTFMQVVTIVSLLSLQIEGPLKAVLQVATLLAFDVDYLKVGCIGNVSPLGEYVSKLLALIAGVVVLCAVHTTWMGIRHHWNLLKMRSERWSVVASVAALIMVFYISITSIVLEPLQCKDHPNGLWTVWSFPSVICWHSDEHKVMLVLAILIFLFGPVSFLACLILVLHQMPSRLRRGDAKFVRTFSFLFFRFKPGLHWFLVVHMIKNLMLACCLIIPSILLQILCLEIVLLAGWGATLLYRPWRMQQAEFLDTMLTVSMLLIVVIVSFFVESTSGRTFDMFSWICAILVVLIVGFLLAAVMFNLWRQYVSPRKRFEFFLCHHKAASGAFTRLLKMCFKETKLGSDVFIDSDQLHNLDHLFDFVRSQTRNLVIVATAEIFTRPWCLGEMTMARLEKLPTVMLVLPGCNVPDDKFVEAIGEAGAMQNSEVLVESGIDMNMVKETLVWVKDIHKIHIGKCITHELMDQIVVKLRSKDIALASLDDVATFLGEDAVHRISTQKKREAASGQKASNKGMSYLIYDTENMDACAACFVLQKLLTVLFVYATDLIPTILHSAEVLPPLSVVMVMCTNGTLENPRCLLMLAQAAVTRHFLYPLVAEPTFRFPPEGASQWLQSLALPSSLEAEDVEHAAFSIQVLFKEIATAFQPNTSSQVVLQVSAEEVHRRLMLLQTRMDRLCSNQELPVRSERASSKAKDEIVASSEMAHTVCVGRLESTWEDQDKEVIVHFGDYEL